MAGNETQILTAGDVYKRQDYTRFIIDAPCSGSGTWRRTPDAKFRITPQRLREILGIQAEILEFGAEHTVAGGRLSLIHIWLQDYLGSHGKQKFFCRFRLDDSVYLFNE